MGTKGKVQNYNNLMIRLQSEPDFKEQLLQEFLDADTDEEIKIKYDLSNVAISTIRREYNWGELIKTTRFSRNWAKEHPKKEKVIQKRIFPKQENLNKLIQRAEEDEDFRNKLFQEFIDLTDKEIIDNYNLASNALTKIRTHFGWSYKLQTLRTKGNLTKLGVNSIFELDSNKQRKKTEEKNKYFEDFLNRLRNDKDFFDSFSHDFIYDESKYRLDTRNKYQLRNKDLNYIRKEFKLYIPFELKQERTLRTIEKQYGVRVDNISRVPEIREKINNTIHSRTQEEQDEINQKMIKTLEDKYGGVGSSSPIIKDKYENTMMERYGVTHNWASKDPEFNGQATLMKEYGVTNASQIPHVASKKSKRYKAEDGTSLDSSWELEVYNFFVRNGIEVERNIPIKFEYNGQQHITYIDFKVDDILLEVKGGHLLKGLFSDRLPVPIDEKIKLYKENHVIVITDRNASYLFGKKDSSESAGLKYPNKCLNPFIGVDIDLFLDPEFPYREDRPHCFYDVSVNGKPTQYDAFNNEKLRWEMIKNRINYVGGFIDSKEILCALNVTRKSKQPSWFSKKFAKNIIKEHITSDIIVDSFAGWGTRYDASIELRKQYIGIDYNKELVDWHKSMGRNIEFGDANLFTYDGECSVFICPPYTDIEIYFDDQDLETTQCEWLEIVMKNIPNAKEYVMVCKVVDEGWEKYIVETKTNKSHFGKNNEYILKLTQEEKNRLLDE